MAWAQLVALCGSGFLILGTGLAVWARRDHT